MPSVREIMLARAKEPAKVLPMDRVSPVAAVGRCSSPALAVCGSPVAAVASPLAMGAGKQSNSTSPAGGSNSVAARPPRPKASSGGPASLVDPKKSSECRRPRRPDSDPGAGRRSPSEPPAATVVADDGGVCRGRSRAAAPKARSASLSRVKLGEGVAAPPVEHKDRGKVPAYLKKRQEEMAEAKRQAARPPSPKAPAGFRKVDISEKESTLSILRMRRLDVEKAMRSLPFNIETVGQKQREKDLQDRMAHLDKLVGMFSKPTVFVPADAAPISSSMAFVDSTEPVESGPKQPAALGGAQASCGRVRAGSRDGSVETRTAGTRHGSAAPWERDSCEAMAPSSNRPCRAGELSGNAQSVLPGSGMMEEQKLVRTVRTQVQVAAPPGGKSNLQLY